MEAKASLKTWIAAGVALLVAIAVVPALTGAAAPAPVTSDTTPTNATQWAYGGEGWSNNSIAVGNATFTWDAVFGWTVVFTVTPTGNGTWMIEEQRTVGTTVTVAATTPTRQIQYDYHAQETDVAFANVTNHSVVYSGGVALPALGVTNASVSINASVQQAVSATFNGHSRSGYLNVSGTGHAATSFSPSLGLIPLNLSGVNTWNSTATASPSASWNVAWTWSAHGFNGTTGSGSGSHTGNLSATGTVTLTGYKVAVPHPFADGKTRVGVVLIISGPFDCYDAFILIPHAFDLFGTAAQPYGSVSYGASAISAENLYVTPGPGGPAVTAADQTFGASYGGIDSATGVTPASAGPGTTVEGQPISTAQASSIDHGLTNTGASSSPTSGTPAGGLLVALVVVGAVVAAVGTIGVISWREYHRRRSLGGNQSGGYGESGSYGVPPAATGPSGAPGAPSAPSGPGSVEDPNRPL
jgi:hypothetical protein